jgi:hypothetical protein
METYAEKWGGPAEFMKRFDSRFSGFAESAGRWVKVVERRGPREIEAAYRIFLTGSVPPETGFILSSR